jgi:DNA (cytosine-5)-methyltransferase 1
MAKLFPPGAFTMSEFGFLREQAGYTIEQFAADFKVSPRTVYRYECGDVQPKAIYLERLKDIASARYGNSSNPSFKFIDLFAGIGGLRRGFDTIGGKCVLTSEWNKYSQQTYLANFACDHEITGDITKVAATDVPEHDVLLAGFPCQPFSLAGVSKKNSMGREHGFRCEAQGTLFFDVARIIEHHRPQAFLLENVKNLVNHDRGKTFKVIHETLTEELGYNISYKVIDGKSWVPQHRERIFIVGFRDHSGFSFDDFRIPPIVDGPKVGSILHPEDGSEPLNDTNAKYLDDHGKVLEKYILSDKLWAYLQEYARKHREKGNGFGCSVVGPNDTARTLSARYYKDGSEILIDRGEGRNPRRLTPRECARLMGFDTPQSSAMVIPVSDTQAYKQFGNAVVVPTVEAIARHMASHLVMNATSDTKQPDLFNVA